MAVVAFEGTVGLGQVVGCPGIKADCGCETGVVRKGSGIVHGYKQKKREVGNQDPREIRGKKGVG